MIFQVQALQGGHNLSSLLSSLDTVNPQEFEQAQIEQSSEGPHVPCANDPQPPSAEARSSAAEDYFLSPGAETAQNDPDKRRRLKMTLPHGLMLSPSFVLEFDFGLTSPSGKDDVLNGCADPRMQTDDSRASTPPPPLPSLPSKGGD